jgi:hypothetical protein
MAIGTVTIKATFGTYYVLGSIGATTSLDWTKCTNPTFANYTEVVTKINIILGQYVDITTAQTIGGQKTFNDPATFNTSASLVTDMTFGGPTNDKIVSIGSSNSGGVHISTTAANAYPQFMMTGNVSGQPATRIFTFPPTSSTYIQVGATDTKDVIQLHSDGLLRITNYGADREVVSFSTATQASTFSGQVSMAGNVNFTNASGVNIVQNGTGAGPMTIQSSATSAMFLVAPLYIRINSITGGDIYSGHSGNTSYFGSAVNNVTNGITFGGGGTSLNWYSEASTSVAFVLGTLGFGVTIYFVRVGKQVTLKMPFLLFNNTSGGTITNTCLSTAAIPANYRPTSTIYFGSSGWYTLGGAYFAARVEINSNGNIMFLNADNSNISVPAGGVLTVQTMCVTYSMA